MASLVLCFLMFQFVTGNENYKNDGILQHINSGIKFAKEFLGSESAALKVADFVVRAFQPQQSTKRRPLDHDIETDSQKDENVPDYNLHEASPLSPLRHLVRLLGLQPRQISAVAVNALIFVAQMITTFLAGPTRPNKQYKSDDLTSWILNKNSRKLKDLIAIARNESLPDLIEEVIQEQNIDEETSCIRLLFCKITPFVNKMQQAVFSKTDEVPNKDMLGASVMYRYLPSSDDIKTRSNFCEKKYKTCNLYE